MLGFESERRLANIFIAVAQAEKELEYMRQRLCLIPDFSVRSAFERFDRNC